MSRLMLLLSVWSYNHVSDETPKRMMHEAAKRCLMNASLWLPVAGRENQEARYTLLSLYYNL